MKIKVKYIFIIVFVILFIILFISIKNIVDSLKVEDVKTLSTIDKYNYSLNENDSPYFKELFNSLSKVLEAEVDEEKYAETISKAFVVDFYSLKYAVSKSDVGGIQFVYSDYQTSFVNKAKNTIYAYVENNIYGKRKQELPNVINAEVTNIEKKAYDGNKIKDESAYYIDLNIEYEKDLGYSEKISLILAHQGEKLEVVKMED